MNLPANTGNARDMSSITALGRSRGGNGNPLQYFWEEPGELQSTGCKTLDMTKYTVLTTASVSVPHVALTCTSHTLTDSVEGRQKSKLKYRMKVILTWVTDFFLLSFKYEWCSLYMNTYICKYTHTDTHTHTHTHTGFPGGSDRKESTCTVEDLGSVPGLGRSSGGGHDNPL